MIANFKSAKEPNLRRERVLMEDAQKILLLNETLFIDDRLRYFGIRDLGLGVYEVGLLEVGAYETAVVNYIPTLKDDGTKRVPYI